LECPAREAPDDLLLCLDDHRKYLTELAAEGDAAPDNLAYWRGLAHGDFTGIEELVAREAPIIRAHDDEEGGAA
jgi:hypothetical protein